MVSQFAFRSSLCGIAAVSPQLWVWVCGSLWNSTPARAKLGRVGECIRERHHRVNKVVRARESYSWGQGLMQMELLGQAEQSKQNKLGVGRPGGLGPPLRSLSASSLGLALPFLGAGPEIPRDLPLNC